MKVSQTHDSHASWVGAKDFRVLTSFAVIVFYSDIYSTMRVYGGKLGL